MFKKTRPHPTGPKAQLSQAGPPLHRRLRAARRHRRPELGVRAGLLSAAALAPPPSRRLPPLKATPGPPWSRKSPPPPPEPPPPSPAAAGAAAAPPPHAVPPPRQNPPEPSRGSRPATPRSSVFFFSDFPRLFQIAISDLFFVFIFLFARLSESGDSSA